MGRPHIFSFLPPMLPLLLLLVLPLAWQRAAEAGSYPISGAACNYAKGRWIRSPHTKPAYSAYSCKSIRSQANCYKNGRRDYNYLNWRWQPDHCTLQRFDSGKFLSRYRNKVIGIAGDSFSANFEDSLQCILSSNSSTSRMTSSLDTEDVSGFVIDAYNVTVLHIAAAFLVDASPISKASSSGSWKINLDKPHSSWANILDHIDVFIFNAGHWFVNAPDNLRQYYIGGVKQSGLTGFTAMKLALTTVRNTIVKTNYAGIPVFLTFSPFHYSDSFNTGGDCAGWWRPMTQEEFQIALDKSEAAEAVRVQLAVFTGSTGSGVSGVSAGAGKGGKASGSGSGSGSGKEASANSVAEGRNVMEVGEEGGWEGVDDELASEELETEERGRELKISDSKSSSSKDKSSSSKSDTSTGSSKQASSKSSSDSKSSSSKSSDSKSSGSKSSDSKTSSSSKKTTTESYSKNSSSKSSDSKSSSQGSSSKSSSSTSSSKAKSESQSGSSKSSGNGGGKGAMAKKPGTVAQSYGSSNTEFGNVKFSILDITLLSLIRPDAHIQNFSGEGPKVDCSHWCTPGLPDTWSDILYSMLMN